MKIDEYLIPSHWTHIALENAAKSLALLWRQEGARGVEDQVQMEADASSTCCG